MVFCLFFCYACEYAPCGASPVFGNAALGNMQGAGLCEVYSGCTECVVIANGRLRCFNIQICQRTSVERIVGYEVNGLSQSYSLQPCALQERSCRYGVEFVWQRYGGDVAAAESIAANGGYC